jgi:hypothetical protein
MVAPNPHIKVDVEIHPNLEPNIPSLANLGLFKLKDPLDDIVVVENDMEQVAGCSMKHSLNEMGTISHNSLSNFHQSDSAQIETPQSQLPPQKSNHKAELPETISSNIPFEHHKLPISINDQTKLEAKDESSFSPSLLLPSSHPTIISSNKDNGEHCSTIKSKHTQEQLSLDNDNAVAGTSPSTDSFVHPQKLNSVFESPKGAYILCIMVLVKVDFYVHV